MRITSLLLSLSAVAALASGTSHAATNLVQNGGFEQTTNGTNKQLTSNGDAGRTTLVGWNSAYNGNARDAGYNFVLDSAIYTTNASAIALRTRDDLGHANGITASPTGGNVFASDPQWYAGALSQTVTGLAANSLYTLSFDYALGQQAGFDKANINDYWAVSFGGSTQNTSPLSIQSGGFSGWQTASMTFTASGASQVLSFLANGGSAGAPPFLLLDNVSLTAAVPEPETWGMLLGGLGLVGVMARRRAARRQA
ncbi:PEPxxWA-CTERM sorting domain-containing protein [Oxalobacteraceae bacterium A2-2]